jgi:Tfp pilus assembly protein PilV
VFSERGPKTNTLAKPAGGAGFSLVEAVIASTIVAVGLLALISLFPVSSANLVASASTTGAFGLAAQQIEAMRNLPFPPAGGNDTQTLGGVTYTRTWTVAVAGATPNRTATITVTITWPGQRNSAESTTTTTMLAE